MPKKRFQGFTLLGMKRIAILGSTGSIGQQTLDVIESLPNELQVVALAAGSNAKLLQEQAAKFGVKKTAVFREEVGKQFGIPYGLQALTDLATDPEVDTVVVSVAGVIGLEPTIAAIRAKKEIALASKEVLVAAGEVVMPLTEEYGVPLLPIDSEHSAIFQCLQGPYDRQHLESIILTASGGPFRGKDRKFLENVTVEQALNHPTWRMGGKITIDSATLMNKALEIIEAKWLFNLPIEKVEAVIHPQSIIHSMVRFKDGSVLGQMGHPNMRLPIQVALLHPKRLPSVTPRWDPVTTPNLTFEPIDYETFPAITLCKQAVQKGGTTTSAFNAANEEAVAMFLEGKISFVQIDQLVAEIVSEHVPQPVTLDAILSVDKETRETLRSRKS
jgi:1-deoxy-D-xylulose-5-phosphate reductoisomerase